MNAGLLRHGTHTHTIDSPAVRIDANAMPRADLTAALGTSSSGRSKVKAFPSHVPLPHTKNARTKVYFLDPFLSHSR